MKRIGFRRCEEEEENEEKVANNIVKKTENFFISPAQQELMETIQSASEIIISDDFSKMDISVKQKLVTKLINSVSLNAELITTKSLIIEKDCLTN